MKKIIIIFFFWGGFPVAGMRKKNVVKKNKTELQVAGWATAQIFLSLSHNTASCIVTGKVGRQRRGSLGCARMCSGGPRHGQPRPRYCHGKVAIRLREATTQPATLTRSLARGKCRDTKFCIVTGDRCLAAGECVTIQSVVSCQAEAWLLGCVATRPAIRQ